MLGDGSAAGCVYIELAMLVRILGGMMVRLVRGAGSGAGAGSGYCLDSGASSAASSDQVSMSLFLFSIVCVVDVMKIKTCRQSSSSPTTRRQDETKSLHSHGRSLVKNSSFSVERLFCPLTPRAISQAFQHAYAWLYRELIWCIHHSCISL